MVGKCSGLAWPPPFLWEFNPLGLPKPSLVSPKANLASQWSVPTWVTPPGTWLSLGLIEISASGSPQPRGEMGQWKAQPCWPLPPGS